MRTIRDKIQNTFLLSYFLSLNPNFSFGMYGFVFREFLPLVFFLWFFFSPECSGQNIAINPTGIPADISALLDVSAANKGILIPRVALASATTTVTIASPATSLLVYNDGSLLAPAGYYYNSGTPASPVWMQLLTSGAWSTFGNGGTTAANFVGTTDNVSLRFRTNNTARMIIDSVGNVGIKTTTPKNALSVKGGSISVGSDAVALGAVNNLIIAGPLAGATQGGGIYDASDNTYLTADYCAYIQNGMKLEGDFLVESGKVGIGTTSPTSLLHTAASTTALGLTIFEQVSNDADSYDLNFRKARGAISAPTVISAADELGTIAFRGYSGAGGYVTGSAIKSIAEGTIATTRVPAHLSFWTGTDAAPTVLTERMRITSSIASSSSTTTTTVTYNIPVGSLVGQGSSCGNGSWYGVSTGPGFDWTSTGSGTATSVTIEINLGVCSNSSCSGAIGSLSTTLNGVASGNFSPANYCNCTLRNLVYTFTPSSGYNVGATNQFRMPSPLGYVGLCPNTGWGSGTDTYARVTTTYTATATVPGSGGNVAIASTDTKSTLAVGGSIAANYRAGNTIAGAATDFFINLNAAGASTLPAASSVAAGTTVIVRNTTASAITLSRAGADTLCNPGVAGCASTSVSVAANSVVRYVSDGTSVWIGW